MTLAQSTDLALFLYLICSLSKHRKFIQSLPDKGNKVLATIEKLKEMMARREDLEEAVAQFEKMTVSRLVERTRLDLSDSDDDISDARNDTSDADVHYKPRHKNNKKISISHSENRQTKQMSYKEWNSESSATPPVYKLEVQSMFSGLYCSVISI